MLTASQQMILSGNHAASFAAYVSDVDVIVAYPITPQTDVVEKLAELIGKDENDFHPEYMRMNDGEHAAMGAAIGASITGCRVFAPTSNQGTEFQYEMLYWAANQRLPIVQTVANRGLAPGWNIWADHQGTTGIAPTGWLVQFASNPQEVHDFTIMQFKVSEDPRVYLPGMVVYDGSYTSHQVKPVSVRERDTIREFLPTPPEDGWEHLKFNPRCPASLGLVEHPEKGIFMESKIKIDEAHKRTRKVMGEVVEEFNELFGTDYGALAKEYGCEDADVIFVAAASLADKLKLKLKNEKDIGLIKLKSLQPFPKEMFQKYAGKKFVVFDRNIDYGMDGGYIKTRIASCMNTMDGVVVGLGGREIPGREIDQVIERVRNEKELPRYLNADVKAAKKITMYKQIPMKNRDMILEKIYSKGASYSKGSIKIRKIDELNEDERSVSKRHKDPGYPDNWLPGGTACQGCTNLTAINVGTKRLHGYKALVTPASCLNVIVGAWPRSSANFPFTNMAFAAGPSAASGIKNGYKHKGIDAHVICWSGDGGAGIGRNALEGAIARKEDIVIVVNDNREFQNTGGQASSTTDLGAWTTTSPYGNEKNPENLAWHIASHNNLPYMATATALHSKDMGDKFSEAGNYNGKGTSYIHLFQPCPSGWKYKIRTSKKICHSAVASWSFPLYEVREGRLWLSDISLRYENTKIEPWLKQYVTLQNRFSKMTPEQYGMTLEKCEKTRDFMLQMDGKMIRPP